MIGSAMRKFGWGATMAIGAGLLLGGCSGTPRVGERAEPEGPPPTYAEVASVYNERLDGLDRLWARANVQVRGRDVEGRRINEQGEGHLQLEKPARLALSLGKLGETYFYLGSNSEAYWWFDLAERDDRRAAIGRHELATPAKAAELGVPVHPLDLIELLGIVTLPEPTGEGDPETVWSDDGTLIGFLLPLEAGWGGRRVWVEPQRFDPVRVELLGTDGEPVLWASLSRYEVAAVEHDSRLRPRVATRIEIDFPDSEVQVRMFLYDPRNRDIAAAAFDLERLLTAFRIGSVRSVDTEVGNGNGHRRAGVNAGGS